MEVLLAKRRLIQLVVAFACLMGACLPAREASPAPRVRSLTAIELPFPGGIGAVGDSPWGLLTGGNSQDRAWLAASPDGLDWDQIGAAVTRKLPRDTNVVGLASRDSSAAVLVNLDSSGDGAMGILWSGDGTIWRLMEPPALHVEGFVRPVGITVSSAGYVVVAYTVRNGVFDVIVARSPDGQRWTRVHHDQLNGLAVAPSAVTSDGLSTYVLLDHTPYEADEDPTLLVGSGSDWMAISVGGLTNQIKKGLAVMGDRVFIGGCTLGPPVAGRIWTVHPSEAGDTAATDLGTGTCVTGLWADASGVTAAGSEGGQAWAWYSNGSEPWDALDLRAADPSRSILQVESVVHTDLGGVVGGTASAPIGGAGGVAPVIWLLPEPQPAR